MYTEDGIIEQILVRENVLFLRLNLYIVHFELCVLEVLGLRRL